MTETVADSTTGPHPDIGDASGRSAMLDAVGVALHERGLGADAELVLLDLNPPAGVSVGRLNPADGALADVYDDPALSLTTLDEAIADHLVRIGRVQPPADAEWRLELFDLIERGRERLQDSDGTFLMGRCHIRLFRLARRDVEEAGRALTARAEELARAAVAGVSAPAIVIGAGTCRWPGLRDAIARAVTVPVVDLGPVAPVNLEPNAHHRDDSETAVAAPSDADTASSSGAEGSTVPSAGGSEPGGSQNSYVEKAVDATVVVDVAAPASPTIADASAHGTRRTESGAVTDEHPISVPTVEDRPEPAANDTGDGAGSDAGHTTGRAPEVVEVDGVVDVEVDGVIEVDDGVLDAEVIAAHTPPPEPPPVPEPVPTAFAASVHQPMFGDHHVVAPYESSMPSGGLPPEPYVDSRPDAGARPSDAVLAAPAAQPIPQTTIPQIAIPQTTIPQTAIPQTAPHRPNGRRRPRPRLLLTGVALLSALAVVAVAVALAVGGGDGPSSSTAVPPTTQTPATGEQEFADPAIYAEARQPARPYTPPPPPPETTDAPAPAPRPRAPRPPPQRGLTLPNPIPGLPPIVLP